MDETVRAEVIDFLNNVRFQAVEGFHVGTAAGAQLTVEFEEVDPGQIKLILTLCYQGEEIDVWSFVEEKRIDLTNVHGAKLARSVRGEGLTFVGKFAGEWLELH